MRTHATVQIVLAILSVVIIFTMIKPKFTEISAVQADIGKYKDVIEKVSDYNNQLDTLLADANGFSQADLAALDRYLPETIDVEKVAYDLQVIAENNDLLLESIAAEEDNSDDARSVDSSRYDPETGQVDTTSLSADAQQSLRSRILTFTVIGQYDGLKGMLQDMERNAYPLRMKSLDFTVDDTGSPLMTYTVSVETYALDTTTDTPTQSTRRTQ